MYRNRHNYQRLFIKMQCIGFHNGMSKHGKGRGSTPIKKFLPLLNPLITLHDFFSAHVCLGGGGGIHLIILVKVKNIVISS
jgi:hypothetical protein